MKKIKIITLIFLIFIITFIAFFPSLRNGFVNWDDDKYVTENAMIQSLSFKSIKNIFSSFHEENYHPLTLLFYALEYHFFGLNPFIYHATNLVLHLLNSLFVFWFIFLLTRRVWVSFLTAIFFGIHPLHVESVAWISERRDVLYSALFLAALIAYLYYRRDKVVNYYYLSLFLYLLSILSKAMALTFPFILLLCDYSLHRRFNKNSLIEKIPFFVISIMFGIITYFAGDFKPKLIVRIFHNISFASYNIIFYLTKIAMPVKLSNIYPYPDTINGLIPLPCLVSLVVVSILSILAIFSLRYTRKVVFGSLFFLITLLPILQLLPSVSFWGVNDRYVYIASIGIFYIVSEGLVWLYKRKIKYFRLLPVFLSAILIIILSTLVLLTWNRSKVWKDSIGLWNDVLNNYPNIATAYNSRGVELLLRKEYNKAYSDFINALSIDPSYYEAYFNLGSLYSSKGNYNEAIKLVNKTLQINPSYLKAYDMLATIYGLTGKHLEVISICKRVIQVKPDHAGAYINLCSAYGNLNNFQEAVVYGEKAVMLNPRAALAHLNLSAAYYYAKKYDLAIMHCDKAIELGYEVCPNFLEELKPYRK